MNQVSEQWSATFWPHFPCLLARYGHNKKGGPTSGKLPTLPPVTHPTTVETLARQISLFFPELSRPRRRFLAALLTLWPGVRGRHNFVNLGRHGDYTEFTYRKHFQRPVDWLAANTDLAVRFCGPRRIIALDPTYLPKAGRHTAGVGYFHSGTAGKRQWGLEVTGLACVDLDDRVALHLDAVQTVDREADETLLDYYAVLVELRAPKLLALSRTLVADAYFSREPFVGRIVGAGFTFVSRLRQNVALRYYYTGPATGGRGRPKTYGANVDLGALDPAVFRREAGLCVPGREVWSGIVELKASRQRIRAVVERQVDDAGTLVGGPRIYFSTDAEQGAAEIGEAYRARFQQEFLYRDAKQFVGVTEGQGRSWEKIDIHVNAALTSVNVAKCAHHLSLPAAERGAFSMAAITQAAADERLCLRIFARCGLDPHRPINQAILRDLRDFRRQAA